ncbi:MAG: glycosyltransferase [Lysobacterales bacterium]
MNAAIVEELVAAGCELTIACKPDAAPTILTSGKRIIPIARWGKWSALRILWSVWMLKPERVVILFDGGSYDQLPWVTLLPLLIRRLPKRPTVVSHLTNVTPVVFGRHLARLFRMVGLSPSYGALALSDRLLFYCDAHRSGLESDARRMLPAAVTPVPAFLRLSRSDAQRASAEELVVAFFGLIYPGKGVEKLVQAAALIRAEGRRVRLVLVGGVGSVSGNTEWRRQCVRYFESLKALVKTTGVACDWHSDLEETRLSEVLDQADVLCLPFDGGLQSNNSSFSNAVSSGIPIVSTRSKIPDAIIDGAGERLTLVDSNDPETLRIAISKELERSTKLGRRRLDLIQWHQENFSMRCMISGLLENVG